MKVSKGLERLLRVRNLQEEQRRAALASAAGNLSDLETAQDAATGRERQGRALFGAGIEAGELPVLHAGVVEAELARRYTQLLAPRIAEAEAETTRLRESFLEKRVERRQAETLIEERNSSQALESNRRAQQTLDDWHAARAREGKAPGAWVQENGNRRAGLCLGGSGHHLECGGSEEKHRRSRTAIPSEKSGSEF